MLLSYVSFGQYLTNLNYSINFGDLAEIDVPYKASKSILDGDYLYHITYSSTTTLGNHILVKKHHVDGTPAWEAVYGDIGPITSNHAVDIKVDASGNVYIVGATKHSTEGYNALVVKYNNIGIKQWDYTYHSSGSDDDIATALDIDGSGNCYITGSTVKTTDKDVFVLKVDNMGNNGFTATYNYDNFDDGGIFIDYVSSSSIEVAAITQDDAGGYQLSKLIYNSTGILQNSYRTNIGYGNMRINDLKAIGGEYMVCGAVENTNGDWDFAVFSLSSSMTTNWSYIHDENGHDDEANALVVDASGNVYATGYVNQNNDEPQLATAKLNSSGTEQWLAAYDYPVHFDSWGKAIDLAGNDLLITGEIVQDNNQTDIITLFTSATDGELNWRKEYNHNNNDIALNAFIIDDLEFVITGNSEEDENFVVGYELFWEDTLVVSDTTHVDYMDNYLIVSFRSEVVNQTTVANKNLRFGHINNFINSTYADSLELALTGFADLDDITVTKMYPNAEMGDTMVITRNGDTIYVEPYWSDFVLYFKNSIDEDSVIEQLDSLAYSFINYTEKDLLFTFQSLTFNDPFLNGKQAGMITTNGMANASIKMEKAWEFEKGKESVRVGIVDNGVMWSHEEFMFEPNNGTKGTKIKNGYDYVDDGSIYKSRLDDHDWKKGTKPSGYDIPGYYYYGHGTWIASIIGALNNNTDINNNYLGMSGIAGGDMSVGNKGVTMVSYTMNQSGSEQLTRNARMSDLADAVSRLYGLKGDNVDFANHCYVAVKDHEVNYTVNDLSNFKTLRLQFWNSSRAGILHVASSGNYAIVHKGEFDFYPASLFDSGILKVGAYTHTSEEDIERLPSSNYGYNLDVLAPGHQKLITFTLQKIYGNNYDTPISEYVYLDRQEEGNEWWFSGTSAATPHATGVAALIESLWQRQNATVGIPGPKKLWPEDIEWIIEQSAKDLQYVIEENDETATAGYDKYTGWGQLDAEKAMILTLRPNNYVHHLEEDWLVSLGQHTLVADEENVVMHDYWDKLEDGKKYKVSVHKVSNSFWVPWPEGYDIAEVGDYGISENGYWINHTRSRMWDFVESTGGLDLGDIWPHEGGYFHITPKKEFINGEPYIHCVVKGYFVYVHRHSYTTSESKRIDKWYPFDPTSKTVKFSASILFTKNWTNPMLNTEELDVNFKVYPNPSNGIYFLEAGNMSKMDRIEIIDYSGKLVESLEINSYQTTVDLSKYPSGVFVFRIYSGNYVSNKRVIKD